MDRFDPTRYRCGLPECDCMATYRVTRTVGGLVRQTLLMCDLHAYEAQREGATLWAVND